MTMDFSQLHTYTPPQCAPENTGYTYSLSSSYSTAALEFEKEHEIAPVYDSPRMSRRSLRLQINAGLYGDDDSQAQHSQNHRSSSSTSVRRETRTLRGRKQQTGSSSQSLSLSQTDTPRKTLSFSTANTPIHSSAQESHAASDASLHASVLDQSHLRQRTGTATTIITTAVDGYWGRSSSFHQRSSGVNGDVGVSASKSHTALVNGYICKDCSLHSPRTDALSTHASSSPSSQAASASTGALSSSASSSSYTSIYSRDKSRRNKTGALVSMSSTCLRYSKDVLAPIASFVTLLFNSVLWLGSRFKSPAGKGVLASCSGSLRQAASSGLSRLWLLKQSTLRRMTGYRANSHEVAGTRHHATGEQAHSSYCGSMNVKDLVTEEASHLKLNGSLCDDCKGKQYSETHSVHLTHSSRSQRLAGALWSLLACAGYSVVRASRAFGSGVGTAAQRLGSLLWMLFTAPVRAGRGLLWFLASGWYQLVSLMSVLNVFFLTRCAPKLWMLLWFLLPFFLLLAFWLWAPSAAALLAYLPAINMTALYPTSPLIVLSNWMPASAPAPSPVPVPDFGPEAPLVQTPATPASQAPPTAPPVEVSSVDMERLERLEQQLALLWKQVKQGDQTQEKRHGDILVHYKSLKEELNVQTDRDNLGVWISTLLQQRLDQEDADRAQIEEQQKQEQQQQQQGHVARLANVEETLQILTAKNEEAQQRMQRYETDKDNIKEEIASLVATPAPLPVSAGVKQEEYDTLLTEVQRLELELGKVKKDLQGVVGCKGKCDQLSGLRDTISAQVSSQVRKELRAVFFGSGQVGEEQGDVPESLILWLSQRYVSTPDLQASLASLERNIMRNVSKQVERSQARTLGEAKAEANAIIQTVAGSVRQTAAAEGLTEEQVKLIVQNALRLYSQDRTGQVDYALESGGGSILSTRCSETYETKTALMSLFGLPLWYFSQSPRVVIQPDVYPGNCWAFKGSQGYLVIRLSMRILPTSVCVEHIPRALSPTGNITSAPQNFTVFGLDDEYQDEGTLLGQYTYQEDGESLQNFPVQKENDKAFQIMEVRVLSNWGHPEYTCLYRIRVHGEPRPQ
ncbi:SUN domain-containing protein 1 isoform X2 [Genypterus blacodes]